MTAAQFIALAIYGVAVLGILRAFWLLSDRRTCSTHRDRQYRDRTEATKRIAQSGADGAGVGGVVHAHLNIAGE